jgi:hypothetical protein
MIIDSRAFEAIGGDDFITNCYSGFGAMYSGLR